MFRQLSLTFLALVTMWFGIGIGDKANHLAGIDTSTVPPITPFFSAIIFFLLGALGFAGFLASKDEARSAVENQNFTTRFIDAIIPAATTFGFGGLYGLAVGPFWHETAGTWFDFWLIFIAIGLTPIAIMLFETSKKMLLVTFELEGIDETIKQKRINFVKHSIDPYIVRYYTIAKDTPEPDAAKNWLASALAWRAENISRLRNDTGSDLDTIELEMINKAGRKLFPHNEPDGLLQRSDFTTEAPEDEILRFISQ